MQISNPKAALGFWNTNKIPRRFAVRADTGGVASPQEGSPFRVEEINDSFRKEDRAHCIDGEAGEHRVNKNLVACLVEKVSTPAGKVFVKPRDQRLKITGTDFVHSERQTTVRLRK